MAPSKQQALLLEAKFGNFAVHTVDVPKPGVGEVLVKVHSVALNPVDWKIQKYGALVEYFPAVLGLDIAGDVAEVGEGVTGVSVGDRVFVQGTYTNTTGGFQQYAIAKLFGKIPHNITYDDASTFPVGLFTAYLGLFKEGPGGFGLANILVDGRNKSSGQAIVVLGGSGSVGQFVLQLAKLAGFSTIITTASLKHADYLKSLGATYVIDRYASSAAVSAEVSKLAGGDGVNYVFDAISIPETQQLGYDLLSADGEIALVLPDAIKNKVEGKKVHNVRGFSSIPANHEVAVLFYEKIGSLVQEGEIKPETTEVLPNGLAGIPDGLKRLENNQVSGAKLVARPQESA
ncbi:GroES (chaperonin 10)-like protein [Amanita muscaria]